MAGRSSQGAITQRLARLPLVVALLVIVALLMLLPAVHAYHFGMLRTARAFVQSGLLIALIAALLGIALQNRPERQEAHPGLLMLLQSYLVLPCAMALPLVTLLPDTSLVNAWFEMVSSFTTTGASVYEPNRLSPSLHLWRAIVGWFGGFVTLVAASAILMPLNLGGAEVVTGHIRHHIRSNHAANLRVWQEAAMILPVYAGLTGALWFGLLLTGEHGLTALIHAMGVLSTSGVQTGYGEQGIMGGTGGLAGEIMMFTFMLIALSRGLMLGESTSALRDVPLRKDPEIRLGLALIALVTIVLMLRHLVTETSSNDSFYHLLRAFWGAAFTAASFLTTTGYDSAWWQWARNWAGLETPGLLLVGLAVVGGGVATTAGGLKLLRIYALFMHGKHELERIAHPNIVLGGGRLGRLISPSGAYMAWVFVMFFFISVMVVLMVLTLGGMGFEEALIFGLAALTSTGALPTLAGSIPYDWAVLSSELKSILALTMIVGRMELLALIALISTKLWHARD